MIRLTDNAELLCYRLPSLEDMSIHIISQDQEVKTHFSGPDIEHISYLHKSPNPSICYYCKSLILLKERIYYRDINIEDHIVTSYACEGCGWWFVIDDLNDDYIDAKYWHSFLKSISPKKLPIENLMYELNHTKSLIYNISPLQFEKLVREILINHLNCSVEHVGRSYDGGIDLLIIESENSIIPVQVKRRNRPNKIESVCVLREFLGAFFIKGYKKAKFVTTADKYSTTAKKYADSCVSSKVLDEFELIDYNRLIEIFEFNKVPSKFRPWRSLPQFSVIEPLLTDVNSNKTHNIHFPAYEKEWIIGPSISK